MTDARTLLPTIHTTLDEAVFWARSAPAGAGPMLSWALGSGGEERWSPALERLGEAAANLRRPLRVAVCGENNSGKSTLINALLGETIAATSFFECTFCPMVLSYGPSRTARILYRDGSATPLSPDAVGGELDNLLQAGRAGDVLRVEVALPLPALRRFELADVPGVGASERNAQVARAFSEKADAILYVLNATLLGQADLLADVRGLALEFEALAIAINKLDQIGLEDAERAVEYVTGQDFGRPLPIFPLAVRLTQPEAEATPEEIQLARRWLAELETTWLGAVALCADRVKATAALGKCQRELVTLTTVLQAAYQQGTRTFAVVEVALRTLAGARESTLKRIKARVSRWLRDEAFFPVVGLLYESLKEQPARSQAELQDRLAAAFGPDALHTEMKKLQAAVNATCEDEWRGIAARFKATSGLTYSPFQLEKAAAFLQRESDLPATLLERPVAPAPGGGETMPFKDLKVKDLETAGRWGGLFGAVVEALVAVGTAVSGASLALSGVGIPAAAVAGAAVLLWTHQRRKRGIVDSSPAEFAAMVEELRQESARQILKSLYPEGIEATVGRQLDDLAEACRAELHRNLWAPVERHAATLETLRTYLGEGDRHLEAVRELRRHVGVVVGQGGTEPRSAAASQVAVRFATPVNYGPGERSRLFTDLGAILALEDAEIYVVDRGLTGAELDWLGAAPPATALRLLVYEVEREATDRAAFLRALRGLRGRRVGLVAVRAVKVAGHDRTPLERFLLCGNDWALELSTSLSLAGTRGIAVSSVPPAGRAFVQREILDRYWTVNILATDPGTSEVHLLDL